MDSSIILDDDFGKAKTVYIYYMLIRSMCNTKPDGVYTPIRANTYKIGGEGHDGGPPREHGA